MCVCALLCLCMVLNVATGFFSFLFVVFNLAKEIV